MADLDDDRLLDALAVALRPDASSAPSLSELMALQAVVSDVRSGTVRARSSRLRRWVAGLLAGGVVLSGGTAYATNPVAPRPVRSAAFALKLPVEAPDLTDAKDALDDLEEELREGRRDQIAAEVEDVLEELADLSSSARRSLEPRASGLLATAAAFLADAAGRSVDERLGGEADDPQDDSGGGSGSDDDSSDSRTRDPDDSRSGTGSDDESSGSGSGGSDDDPSGGGTEGSGSGSDDDTSGGGTEGSGSGSDDDTSDRSDDSSGSGSDDSSESDSSSDDSSGSGSDGSESDGRDSDEEGGVSASSGDEPAVADD